MDSSDDDVLLSEEAYRRQQQRAGGRSAPAARIVSAASATAGSRPDYAWERRYERTWDVIQVDDVSGALVRTDQLQQQRQRHAQLEQWYREVWQRAAVGGVGGGGGHRGLIRYLVLVLDTSAAMRPGGQRSSAASRAFYDLKPNRWAALFSAARQLVRDYFDENAISQLALVALRDGLAHVLSDMSSSPRPHMEALQALEKGSGDGGGAASLQNGLEVARRLHAAVPRFGTREVLLLYGALSTCDPGDIHQTVEECAADGIRISIVGLAAEMHILRTACEKTGGVYRVPLHTEHFRELVRRHRVPPAGRIGRQRPGERNASATAKGVADDSTQVTLVCMGFPPRVARDAPQVAIDSRRAQRVGYACPRCRQWLADVPGTCILCGLTLTHAPQLARSYHHLFPAPRYVECAEAPAADGPSRSQPATDIWECFGCRRHLRRNRALCLQCTGRCGQRYCVECDQHVHQLLHNCPGCEALFASDTG
ncbi:hypothetical protein CDCA_CDCA02G0568 [Cyanidium caldarium]|uniref:General transcription factor IIH subunit n=1 Tax=Cyanidium caldarium TaxID=2771 RepID=A0AAV9IRK0_CYACA|nr:hypothetical protein CDCA_CDCA02G0568 [Cyanidium caldarium]|eukprot:ctg_312.g156